MQKLERRDTYTPTDASQVRGNCDCGALNMVERPSGHNLKTLSNNSDVNQLSGKTGQGLRVPVLNMRGKPLMPTSPAKARHLLEQGKATVVTRKPFTIQLTIATGESKQPITVGMDIGYKTIGISAITDKAELISGEVECRTNIPDLLIERAMYRRSKRNRHHWYRPNRQDNRRSKKDGWLPPSVRHKGETYIRLAKKLSRLLPITNNIVEIGKFDIQKIQNPDIQSIEYQQGEMYQYRNRIAYLLARENYKCQFCGKDYKKGDPWRLHHIHGKAHDKPEDWALLHESCHTGKKGIHALHKEDILRNKPVKSYKAATVMNILQKYLRESMIADFTYGNITFQNRIDLGLEKNHINDAFVIAGGKNKERCKPYNIKQVRRNNRCLQINRKGYKPAIRRQRYKLQPKDIVRYQNKEYLVSGIHSYGKCVRITDGTTKLNVNTKKVEFVCYGKGFQFISLGKFNEKTK